MVVHPQVATTAHLASCAAAKQGKYPAFKNALWAKGFDAYASARDPSKLGEDNIIAIAKDVGLDTDKLKADMKSRRVQEASSRTTARSSRSSTSTRRRPCSSTAPTSVARCPKEQFKTMIDEKLKVVEQSGVPGAEYYDKEVMGKGEKQFRSKKDPKPS